jgi:hypothetical protein
MRTIAGIAVVLFFMNCAAFSQIPSGNVYVGYVLSRTDSFGGTTSLNGWEASLEGKFLPWIGVVADFSTGYGTDNSFSSVACPGLGCPPPLPPTSTALRRYTYLFGPRLSIPIGRFTPFAHALFGAAHINDQEITDTSFATAVGGGLDYKLIKGIAWRFQLDSVHTNFFSTGENHLRFSTGIDLRF